MIKNQKGFTLIELIVIITIIISLAAVAVPNLVEYKEKQREMERKAHEEAIEDALRQYYALEGEYIPAGDNDGNDIEDWMEVLDEEYFIVFNTDVYKYENYSDEDGTVDVSFN